MDDNQDFDEKSPDLYEEVLISESLDQYEGLLNRSKSTRAYLENSTKEIFKEIWNAKRLPHGKYGDF